VWNANHAKNWEEAMVSGNGKQGVMVFGNPNKETIIGNHSRLYLPHGKNQQLPNMAPHLNELRTIIEKEGYEVAKKFYYDKAMDLGYRGLTMSDPSHPAFHLYIRSDVGEVTDYSRSVNFETGEISIQFMDENNIQHIRNTFVSRVDDLLVHSMKNNDRDVSCILEIEDYENSLIEHEREISSDNIRLNNNYVKSNGGYEVDIRIEAPGGEVSLDGHTIKVTHAQELLLLIKISTFKTNEEGHLGKDENPHSVSSDYALLLQRHEDIHKEMFNRVILQLASNDERRKSVEELVAETKASGEIPLVLIEKLYDVGRYMFICSAGELSPNLQGLWTGTFEPAWSGDFTFDTNVQLSIASALSAGLQEGMHGFFRLIKEFMPGFRENAQMYYGSRGIMSSAHSSNTGRHFHWNEEWPLQFWTCGAGWLGHWFYQYYLHTGDKEFLVNETIPYLKECALFYEDFLTEDITGGYRFSPSYSAENGCGDNSTQDIAVAKEVLSNLIASYNELGIDSPEILKWKEMIDKLPDYLINSDGVLKEWAVDGISENYNHRHFSHLYPIFQSREFTAETEPELWSASKKAFDKRLDAWLRNPEADTSSTHGRMHAALCATQFNQQDLIYEIFQMMIVNDAIYPTLMTSHYNNQDVFNVDGNGSMPQIIHEMLIDGTPGVIKLLYALPNQIAKGKISGVLLVKQIKVEEFEWDVTENQAIIKLYSRIDQDVLLDAPLFPKLNIVTSDSCETGREGEKWKIKLLAHKIATIHLDL
jgi:hypothetical protein